VPETPIAFDGVELLCRDVLGCRFRIDGRDVFVGHAVPLEGTTVHLVGEIGRLVLPRWFVQQERIECGIVAIGCGTQGT
jgi:hypothetical protein